jgi:hypothetical protein
MDRLRGWAFGLAGAGLAVSALGTLSGFVEVAPREGSFAFDLMVLSGTAPSLVACALLAIRRERLGGTLLMLASAVAALGLGLRSGPHVGRYLIDMVILVVPQIAAAALFLAHARREERRGQQAAKKRRPTWRT